MSTPRKAAKKKTPPAKRTRAQMVNDTIEDAMRPYLGVLPDHALKTMRDILEDTMATHPVAVEAFDEMEKEAAVADGSGTRVRDGGKGGGKGGGEGEGGAA